MVITTVQLHSTKPELRFCAGSNPTNGMSENKCLSSVNHTTKHHSSSSTMWFITYLFEQVFNEGEDKKIAGLP